MSGPAYCIFLQYTDRFEANGMARLRRIAPRLFPEHQIRYLIVDNAAQNDLEVQVASDCDRIRGDNTVREFTGYQRGLEWIASRHPFEEETPVLFANDTFFRNYGDKYLSWFQPRSVAGGLARGAMIGYIDAFPQAVQLGSLWVREWVRTSFFIVPFGVALRLKPFAVELTEKSLFKDGEGFFREPSPLSENYRDYLRTWLFGEARRPEFTHHWHSSALLDDTNRRSMQQKTMCILSEHALSARALSYGIPIQPVRPKTAERVAEIAFGIGKQAVRRLLRSRLKK